jgi:ABC-type glycerol-3-phosphate transport system substrate-binding protein
MLFHRKALMLAVLLTLVVCFGGTASAQPTERCFPETGQCVTGPIRAYWEHNGGQSIFGYPITPLQR